MAVAAFLMSGPPAPTGKPRFAGLLFSIPPISHHHSRAPAGAVIGGNPNEKRARERAKVRRLKDVDR
jgi:hypothetical protein